AHPTAHSRGQRTNEQFPVGEVAWRRKTPCWDAGEWLHLITRLGRPACHAEQHPDHLDPVRSERIHPALERRGVEPCGIAQIGTNHSRVRPPRKRDTTPAEAEP